MGLSKIGIAIQQFIAKHQDVGKVKITDTGVDIFFKDNPTEPFSILEFLPDSPIRRNLAVLEAAIYDRSEK
jgi:hypothetical protein